MLKKILTILMLLCLCNHLSAQVANYCLRLSPGGSVDCGPMPELDGQKAFTVQFWMYADTWAEDATLMSRGDDFSVRLGAEGKMNITLGGTTYLVNSTDLAPGRWNQVTILSTGTRIRTYVNKKQLKSSSLEEGFSEAGGNFILGGDRFRGRFDEVRVWNAELSSDYDYFMGNTLNKWVPQLDNLVAYYKFDQPQCTNIVDYKALFVPRQKTNHHGIPSATGVANLLCGAYTNNIRFYDSAINKEKFLLANDLIILGIQAYSDGHLRYLTTCDHGTVKNAEYLDEFEGRKGVISFKGAGAGMECTTTALETGWSENGNTAFTVESWVYIDEWTEGAYIFRKESESGKQGLSIRLGDESKKQIAVRVDGKDYFFHNTLSVGKWQHLAIMPGPASRNTNVFMCYISGRTVLANAELSAPETSATPTNLGNFKMYIGENLKGKLDDTATWRHNLSTDEMSQHRNGNFIMPGLGKSVNPDAIDALLALYRYNYPKALGWDYYSQDEWKNIMESAYAGYHGFQTRISVQGNWDWQSTISDPAKRKIFAADLAELSKPYAGVELDLEWMEGPQTNLGLLADEIKAALPAGKSFMISMHPYGAYRFPLETMSKVDGFTFQQYGDSRGWFTWDSFEGSYTTLKDYGYPDDKMYFSYSTTTSAAYDDNGNIVGPIAGLNWGFINDSYVPATDGRAEEGVFNGQYYYFHGPAQIYRRARYVMENNLQGIFYWDMCNDLPPSHKYSLARNCNYGLNCNVDPYVEEVEVNHPTSISDIRSSAPQELGVTWQDNELAVAVPVGYSLQRVEVFSTAGQCVLSTTDARIAAQQLVPGVYVLRACTTDGQVFSTRFIKN